MRFSRRDLPAALALALLCSRVSAADDDLSRIPNAAGQQQTNPDLAQVLDATGASYLQDDVLVATGRQLAVPLPPPPGPRWEERLFFDARLNWALDDEFSFVYSGRMNLRVEDGLDSFGHENIRHDLREAYFVWQIDPDSFVDFGRINLKSGVALGFNPTDFFRTRAVVEPSSADPSVLREDRLGTLMLQGQHIWDWGALTLAFAPKLYDDTAIYANLDLPSFDPMLDRTNARERFLAKTSVRLSEDLVPELLYYNEAGRSHFGVDLTHAFGRSVVGYAEWAGGDRASLVHDALAYGEETGTIPPGSPSVIPESGKRSFRNDLAIGASYATELGITVNAEFDFHEAGFSDRDWRDWFDTGIADRSLPGVAGALWYIRGYAADQLEPVGRDDVFVRADWRDAIVRDLNLAAFVLGDTRDGSGLVQATAQYYLSRDWTIGGLVDCTYGRRRSDFGSLPDETEVFLKLTKYL